MTTVGSGAAATDRIEIQHRNGDGLVVVGTVRASGWGDLFDCAYRWYWKEIEGVRGKSGGGAIVGSGVHKGTHVFDAAKLAQRPVSIEAAVAAAADYVNNPTGEDGVTPQEIDWTADDEKLDKGNALDLAVKLTEKYCRVIAPTKEYSAVEVKCTKLDVRTDFGVVRMTGTTDRVQWNPDRSEGIEDFKTGAKAVEGITSPEGPRAVTKGHGPQLGAYTMMTEAQTGRRMGRAAILGFQANSKLHIAEGYIENPKRALVGTATRPGMIELAAQMLKSGIFPPNPKSMLCSKKWCPAWDRCVYHD